MVPCYVGHRPVRWSLLPLLLSTVGPPLYLFACSLPLACHPLHFSQSHAFSSLFQTLYRRRLQALWISLLLPLCGSRFDLLCEIRGFWVSSCSASWISSPCLLSCCCIDYLPHEIRKGVIILKYITIIIISSIVNVTYWFCFLRRLNKYPDLCHCFCSFAIRSFSYIYFFTVDYTSCARSEDLGVLQGAISLPVLHTFFLYSHSVFLCAVSFMRSNEP